MTYPMQGIKVLDFSAGVAGPHAGMLCAQYGADVVKIEVPEGDWGRELGQQYGDLGPLAIVYNQGKRSLAIDLKDPEALHIVRKMAEQADVIIEAFRPGVMHKFGLDYASVCVKNSKIIYLSITGFGSVGPLANSPATDGILQGFTGLMKLAVDPEGMPQRVNLFVIDTLTGLYGFQAIAAQLLSQARHGGLGKHIDCSLMKAAIAFQSGRIVQDHIQVVDQPVYVPLGAFATSDGHISISVRRDDHFASLCSVLDRDDLVRSRRYETGKLRIEQETELVSILRAEFRKHATQTLEVLLNSVGVLHARINSYPEVLAHEQVIVNDVIRWQSQDGLAMKLPIAQIPGIPDRAEELQAPHVGEHSLQILREYGVEQATIDSMTQRGALKGAKKVTTDSRQPIET